RPTRREDRTGHIGVLVELGAERRRQDASADDRQGHLAALQGVRPADRLPRAEAARPTAWRRHGSPGAAPRSRAGPRVARTRADRHDADLRDHPTAAAEARGVVLRGTGDADTEGQQRDSNRSFSRERKDATPPRRPLTCIPCLRNTPTFLKHGAENLNEIELVAPTGFEPLFSRDHVFAKSYMVLALDSIDASDAIKTRTRKAHSEGLEAPRRALGQQAGFGTTRGVRRRCSPPRPLDRESRRPSRPAPGARDPAAASSMRTRKTSYPAPARTLLCCRGEHGERPEHLGRGRERLREGALGSR